MSARAPSPRARLFGLVDVLGAQHPVDRFLATPTARTVALALLLAAVFVAARADLLPLLAWTAPVVPATRLPWMLGLFFLTFVAFSATEDRLRRPILLVSSLAAACLFDPRFAAISLLFFVAYHRVVYAPIGLRWKLAFLVATFAGWAVAADLAAFPNLAERRWLLDFAYAFAVSYTFRVFYLLYEARLRRFAPVPLCDFLIYFLATPYFVIVPYMFAIPRLGRFAEGLDKRNPALERRGLRHLLAGLVVGVAWHLFRRLLDPRLAFVASLRAGDLRLALPMGLLYYPVGVLMNVLGTAYVLAGLLKVLGFDVPPAFDRPLSSTSVLEWWRRWNIHFRNFLVDIFFYPLMLRWRRVNPYLAIVGGCAAVFLVGSTLFHLPKRYFAHSSHLALDAGLLVENGLWFLLVSASLCLEKRRLLAGARPAAASPLRRGLLVARTWAVVFVVVVACGYGTSYLVDVRPKERTLAQVAAARVPARAGDLDAAWRIVGPELGALRRQVAWWPRDPAPQLALAFALALPGPARDLGEARQHLRIGQAFLDDAEPARRELLDELYRLCETRLAVNQGDQR